MKKLFAMIAIATMGFVAQAQTTPAPAAPYVPAMSFQGQAAMNDVKAGKLTVTVRLGDRTQAPSSLKVGLVLPLVNTKKEEDPRSFEDQVKDNKYGWVELTKVTVSQVTALTPAEQEELKKFYTQDKIDAAKGVVTVTVFKFKATK
jgi:hypothetical protein